MSNGKDEKVGMLTNVGECEFIVSTLTNAYRSTMDEKYLDDALITWGIIKKYIIDCKDGNS